MNSKLYCINPNTKEYEEVKTICGINIEEILDLIKDYKMSKDLKFDKFGKLEEIKRLKEEYVILQNASDEVEEEKDREIERLQDLCNKYEKEHKTTYEIWKKDIYLYNSLVDRIDKAIELIHKLLNEEVVITDEDNIYYGEKVQRSYFSDSELGKIENILNGGDKE